MFRNHRKRKYMLAKIQTYVPNSKRTGTRWMNGRAGVLLRLTTTKYWSAFNNISQILQHTMVYNDFLGSTVGWKWFPFQHFVLSYRVEYPFLGSKVAFLQLKSQLTHYSCRLLLRERESLFVQADPPSFF